MCALGASYGGYMVNWIAGNWNEPWKCLVIHDGNLDERFAYFDTEELWFPEWEHGGTPWENPAGYAKHNPIDHVAKWKTPTLVVHGGQGLPRGGDRRHGHLHRAPAQGRSVEVPLLPRREPLGAQAAELDRLARDGARLARPVDEVTLQNSPSSTPCSSAALVAAENAPGF